MKTIVEINSTNYASTGNIMLNIAKQARLEGYNVYTCCKASKESFKHRHDNEIIIGNRYERILSSFLCELTGLRDHFNIFGTYSFIEKIKKIKPDLIHLHVLHDDFINIRIFFRYLSSLNIPIIWTFHDCSPMTGKCPYFDMIKCNKWRTGCNNCPQLHSYARTYFFDTSRKIWNERKKYFTNLKDLTIVSPSKWLASIVKESYFKSFDTKVINNGIDLEKFKPIDNSIKKQLNIEDKYLVLGIANVWSVRKGLDVFVELSKLLPGNYQIVLVGTNNEIDKQLPNNIISIHRTYNQEELVKIYSAADVFVNPTREENFPTVNIEALACGTPVLTFDTGGSPEIVDETCGVVVNKNDIDSLLLEIKNICETSRFERTSCVKRSQTFDMNITFKKYINLYKDKISQ